MLPHLAFALSPVLADADVNTSFAAVDACCVGVGVSVGISAGSGGGGGVGDYFGGSSGGGGSGGGSPMHFANYAASSPAVAASTPASSSTASDDDDDDDVVALSQQQEVMDRILSGAHIPNHYIQRPGLILAEFLRRVTPFSNVRHSSVRGWLAKFSPATIANIAHNNAQANWLLALRTKQLDADRKAGRRSYSGPGKPPRKQRVRYASEQE